MVKIAMWILSRAMKKDYGYAWSWHCNVAMVAVDAGASHGEANKRASDFMHIAFGIRTDTEPQCKPSTN